MKPTLNLIFYPHSSQEILRIFLIRKRRKEIGFFSFLPIGRDIYIHQFEIYKDYQRKGMGTEVFQHLEKNFKKKGTNRILIKEVDSTNFWEKMGFKNGVKKLTK